MVHIVNIRMVWYLESNKAITNSQCGFRNHRSTIDNVVKLETSIREVNIQKHHLIAVFFDQEKAYETTWKFGIMKDLHSLGLRGRLPNFIKSFLSERQFRVRIEWTFTNLYTQKEGGLQGSILSVTLFNIKINRITTGNWWLSLRWRLLYNFQINIYENCRVSTATMHQ